VAFGEGTRGIFSSFPLHGQSNSCERETTPNVPPVRGSVTYF